MKVLDCAIKGVYLMTPEVHEDERGAFLEWYQTSTPPLPVVQGNMSISRERTLRGIHYSREEHGQYKYVTCTRGEVWDLAIDLRPGSPTFAGTQQFRLSERNRRALQLPPGVGHLVIARDDHTTLMYLQTTKYDPEAEKVIWALDPRLSLDIPYNRGTLILSKRDSSAERLEDSDVWREHHARN